MRQLANTPFPSDAGEVRIEARPALGKGNVVPFNRRDTEATRLIDLVAAANGVSPLLIRHRSRRNANIVAARQLAMYLMHVVLGRSLTAVGHCFGRDRTTVSHACAQVEDRRDEPKFDAQVLTLEAALVAADATVEAHREAG